MSHTPERAPSDEHDPAHPPATIGRVLHSARGYDLVAWLMTLGRETAFRDRIIDLADLAPGDSVLDAGCGTGTLALRAKRRVGLNGVVHGIDASPEMIARARRKAQNAAGDVVFETAIVEKLPFIDASFDVVFSTLMLHHLPSAVRRQAAREMARVLKPGGRVVIVDFGASGRKRTGLFGHFQRHGRVPPNEVIEVLTDAGLSVTASGPMGMRSLHFATAIREHPHTSK